MKKLVVFLALLILFTGCEIKEDKLILEQPFAQ